MAKSKFNSTGTGGKGHRTTPHLSTQRLPFPVITPMTSKTTNNNSPISMTAHRRHAEVELEAEVDRQRHRLRPAGEVAGEDDRRPELAQRPPRPALQNPFPSFPVPLAPHSLHALGLIRDRVPELSALPWNLAPTSLPTAKTATCLAPA